MQIFDSSRGIVQHLSALASSCREPLSGIREVYTRFGDVHTEPLELAHQQVVKEGRPVGETVLRKIIDPKAGDPCSVHYKGLAQALFPWADFQRVLSEAIDNPASLKGLSPQDAGTLADLIETFARNKLSYLPKLAVYKVDRNVGHNLDATLRGILSAYKPGQIETLISNLRALSTRN